MKMNLKLEWSFAILMRMAEKFILMMVTAALYFFSTCHNAAKSAIK